MKIRQILVFVVTMLLAISQAKAQKIIPDYFFNENNRNMYAGVARLGDVDTIYGFFDDQPAVRLLLNKGEVAGFSLLIPMTITHSYYKKGEIKQWVLSDSLVGSKTFGFKVIISFWSNGKILSCISTKNGTLHGTHLSYSRKGYMLEISEYYDGIRKGIAFEWLNNKHYISRIVNGNLEVTSLRKIYSRKTNKFLYSETTNN